MQHCTAESRGGATYASAAVMTFHERRFLESHISHSGGAAEPRNDLDISWGGATNFSGNIAGLSGVQSTSSRISGGTYSVYSAPVSGNWETTFLKTPPGMIEVPFTSETPTCFEVVIPASLPTVLILTQTLLTPVTRACPGAGKRASPTTTRMLGEMRLSCFQSQTCHGPSSRAAPLPSLEVPSTQSRTLACPRARNRTSLTATGEMKGACSPCRITRAFPGAGRQPYLSTTPPNTEVHCSRGPTQIFLGAGRRFCRTVLPTNVEMIRI